MAGKMNWGHARASAKVSRENLASGRTSPFEASSDRFRDHCQELRDKAERQRLGATFKIREIVDTAYGPGKIVGRTPNGSLRIKIGAGIVKTFDPIAVTKRDKK